MDVVKKDMKMVGLREEDAQHSVRWRGMICYGDPLKGTAEVK